MNTEQLKAAALKASSGKLNDELAYEALLSPSTILALLECVDALRRIADPRNVHFAGDAQVVASAALQKLEAL